MVEPLPPYPPHHDAWRYPPPPVSRHWLWVAIGGGVVALVAIIAFFTSLVVTSASDLPASVDDPEILDAIDSGCSTLDQVRTIDVDSLDIDRVARIEAQTTIVRDVLAGWLELDADLRASDEPFDDWLDDWQRIVDARDAYVVDLQGNPDATFDEPEVDGEPIVDRMDAVMTGCSVPITLLSPDAGIAART
ncbi:hypothetical protein [Aeromicrobium sp. Leaf350]|uniref:hypothetical protein n=1 Tax=Aeromicrobium sp. Leaf350 TaxID=2876565 RepID=UPI001E2B0ECD|nr:hypothetical protein [Aeromicrobium sp. Leaf350]